MLTQIVHSDDLYNGWMVGVGFHFPREALPLQKAWAEFDDVQFRSFHVAIRCCARQSHAVQFTVISRHCL